MTAVDSLWLLLCSALVLLMQGGFGCLESGLVRSKNNINVAVKNLSDFAIACLVFWAVGFALMFGTSVWGVVGSGSFLFEPGDRPHLGAFFVFQMMFCGTATTIVSGAVAERVRFAGYVLISLIVSGLVYPMFGHWAWGGTAAGAPVGWLAKMGFVDFAGSTVVHSTGAWVALAAVLVVGARQGRFSTDRRKGGTRRGVTGGHNYPFAMLGVALLWFGWLGFNGGSTLRFDGRIPHIVAVTSMGGAAGGVAGLLAALGLRKLVDARSVINGVLAGLVSVTAACHALSLAFAVLIGAAGGLVAFVATSLLERCRIDDAVGAIPVHGAAGAWGTIAVGLFGRLDLLGTGLGRVEQVAVQVLGVLVAFAWAAGVGGVIILGLNRLLRLRVSPEDERVGLNVAEHGASTEVHDLLVEMGEHRRRGRFDEPVVADAYTEAGQIAAEYNLVLRRVVDEQECQADIRRRLEKLARFVELNPAPILRLDDHWRVLVANTAARSLLADPELEGKRWHEVSPARLVPKETPRAKHGMQEEIKIGDRQYLLTYLYDAESSTLSVFGTDMTERNQLVEELHQGRKLQSVGELAAGIAHEINTPVQYVGDNARFLRDAFEDMMALARAQDGLLQAIEDGTSIDTAMGRVRAAADKADVPFLRDEVPQAFEHTLEGIQRVGEIVGAMKEFAHPGTGHKANADLNRAIRSTVTIARNNWKDVADVELQLDPELPPVACMVGELNQVFLGIIVNAAQALAGVEREDKGVIRIVTSQDADWVEIRIEDDGPGMPESVKSRVFEPFFTTKDVGEGTGQGLAIARSHVVDHHGGTLEVESEVGQGTTFVIRLPNREPETEVCRKAS